MNLDMDVVPLSKGSDINDQSVFFESFNETNDYNVLPHSFFYDRPEEMADPTKTNPLFIPIIVTHTATFIIGVIGNLVVIFTWTAKARHQSPTASFLVSLAIADLILLVLYVPLETIGYFVITSDKFGAICKLSAYIEMLSGMASVLNLVAVSIERFLVIVYPMKARYFCTIGNSRKGLFVVWALSLVLSTPVLFTKEIHVTIYENNVTQVTCYYCSTVTTELGTYVAFYQLFLLFIIPGLFMMACYTVVIKVLWSSTKTIERLTAHSGVSVLPPPTRSHRIVTDGGVQVFSADDRSHPPLSRMRSIRESIKNNFIREESTVRPGRSSSSTIAGSIIVENGADTDTSCVFVPRGSVSSLERRNLRKRKIPSHHYQTAARKQVVQVIKMLVFVIILFLVCWGPRLIFQVIVQLGLQSFGTATYNFRVSSYLLSFIHSALNPFVYGLMSSTFRNIVFKSCAGGAATEATNGPESCGVSGRIIVGKIRGGGGHASGVWTADDIETGEQEMIAMMGRESIPVQLEATTSFLDSARRSTSPAFRGIPDDDSRPSTKMEKEESLHI